MGYHEPPHQLPLARDVYINCDELENLPVLNKENYLYETNLLQRELCPNTNILQVGSMDGKRIIRLLKVRPDLKLTGLELEEDLVKIAEQNIAATGINANFIAGDITNPPPLPQFDYVICLNNTLGYIPKQKNAIEEMKKLGKTIISVYGEKFDDNLARAYFEGLQLEIESIENNIFFMKDFTIIKRYTRNEVVSWGGKVVETPIGYFCTLHS